MGRWGQDKVETSSDGRLEPTIQGPSLRMAEPRNQTRFRRDAMSIMLAHAHLDDDAWNDPKPRDDHARLDDNAGMTQRRRRPDKTSSVLVSANDWS